MIYFARFFNAKIFKFILSHLSRACMLIKIFIFVHESEYPHTRHEFGGKFEKKTFYKLLPSRQALSHSAIALNNNRFAT